MAYCERFEQALLSLFVQHSHSLLLFVYSPPTYWDEYCTSLKKVGGAEQMNVTWLWKNEHEFVYF